MFSQSAQYAIRAVVLLSSDGTRLHGREIAERLDVPPEYLSKILMELRRHGVLAGQKGWGGGFKLAKPPAKILVGEVIAPFEGIFALPDCVMAHDGCGGDAPCPLHGYWGQIKETYRQMTETVTVADLVGAGAG